jgi:hypothetical protein
MLVAVLVVAMAVPSVAFAKKGGVPASMRGRGHGVVAASDSEAADVTQPGKNEKVPKAGKKGKAIARPVDPAEQSEEASAGGEAPVREQKRTGIANALERLQRNLARMQAQLDAGQRTSLPLGLQRVIAKFMGWLGLGGEDPEAPPAEDGDASEEPTGTVEPTSTVEPTETVEPQPAP